jgi:hypothetical protein
MTQLTLTADQTALLSGSDSSLLVCRPDGQIVGVLSKVISSGLKDVFTEEELEESRKEMRETTECRTTKQVFERLATLGRNQ